MYFKLINNLNHRRVRQFPCSFQFSTHDLKWKAFKILSVLRGLKKARSSGIWKTSIESSHISKENEVRNEQKCYPCEKKIFHCVVCIVYRFQVNTQVSINENEKLRQNEKQSKVMIKKCRKRKDKFANNKKIIKNVFTLALQTGAYSRDLGGIGWHRQHCLRHLSARDFPKSPKLLRKTRLKAELWLSSDELMEPFWNCEQEPKVI